MYKRIVIAYDGSESGQKALLGCRDIAQLAGAQLFLVAVMPPPLDLAGGEVGIHDPGREERDRAEYDAILADGLRQLADAGHHATGEVVMGDAVDEIARYARRIEADLVVVGHRKLKGWAMRWWRGSVSKSLIEHSPCSLLVVITQ